jgi:hypothetical protein
MKGLWETNEILVAQNGRIEVDEGDVDADEAEVVAVSEDLLHTTSGTGNPMLMNTEERDVAVATKENITGVELPFVVTDLTEEEGDAGDADKTKTTTMAMDDPLLIMVLTHFPRRTPLTRHHLSL